AASWIISATPASRWKAAASRFTTWKTGGNTTRRRRACGARSYRPAAKKRSRWSALNDIVYGSLTWRACRLLFWTARSESIKLWLANTLLADGPSFRRPAAIFIVQQPPEAEPGLSQPIFDR